MSATARAVLSTAAWLLTGGLLLLFGAPLHWAALTALPVAALAHLATRLPGGGDVLWSPVRDHAATSSQHTHHQASVLAGRLADATEHPVRFTTRVQPRLRALALARLRQRHGVSDLADPRAARLLGPELHALLTDPGATAPPPDVLARLLEDL
ncbi:MULTISPECIES: hypothetical protein [Actinosynnema]|uniref:hypothetical protein n=1 Tax=Actinosynnema TaxID=40566 RepID=UPI0020A537D8|nr:hypothetical protein [Actinosynnema pretiosum]MCP2096030.1 hypothetical protein [Actinosynnema pretiosum]